MLLQDLRTASATKLAALCQFYGIRQQGVRQFWGARKCATSPTGKVHYFKASSHTVDLRLAMHRLIPLVEQFVARVQSGKAMSLTVGGEAAPLGAIEEVYLRAATCSRATRLKNINDLRAMVETVHQDVEFEQLTAGVLDGRWVRQWQLQAKERAEATHLPHDVEACERAKRGANARYRRARSVFSRGMLRAYEDAGLVVPATVREFAQQGFLKAKEAPPPAMIDDATERAIDQALPALKLERPGAWAAYLLMRYVGLRNVEAVAAQWRWLRETADGQCWIDVVTRGEFAPKGRDGWVRMDGALVEALRSVRAEPADPQGQDYLIPGKDLTDRRAAAYRDLGAWLVARGVERHNGKLAYRLRGSAITRVFLAAAAAGVDADSAAQEFARHRGSATTRRYYIGAKASYEPLKFAG